MAEVSCALLILFRKLFDECVLFWFLLFMFSKTGDCLRPLRNVFAAPLRVATHRLRTAEFIYFSCPDLDSVL